MVAISTAMILAVIGFGSRTVLLSTRNTTVSITQVVPPTIANLSSSRCLIAIRRKGSGIQPSTRSTTAT